jgi:predicted HNH restriction endonuclease
MRHFWLFCRRHTFDNLIVLCPNCHRYVTNGEIDQKAVRQIKANLSVLAHRYSEMESDPSQ